MIPILQKSARHRHPGFPRLALLLLTLLLAAIPALAVEFFTVDGIKYQLLDGKVFVSRQDESLSGDIIIPEKVNYNRQTYSVTRIGLSAFYGCCTGLTSITIPNSVTVIGYRAFMDCTGLTSLTLPESVNNLSGSCFFSCTLKPLKILSKESLSISSDSFSGMNEVSDIVCYHVNYDRIKERWSGNIFLIDEPAAAYNIVSNCCGISFNADNPYYEGNISDVSIFAEISRNSSTIVTDRPVSSNGNLNFIDGLQPDTYYTLKIYYYSGGEKVVCGEYSFRTKDIIVNIPAWAVYPNAIECKGSYELGDAKLGSVEWLLDGKSISNSDKLVLTGLKPETVKLVFRVKVACEDGSDYIKTDSRTFKTAALELEIQNPKSVGNGKTIVAAKTNLSENEPNVGFEWKKYDAPESLPYNRGFSAICDGTVEGPD